MLLEVLTQSLQGAASESMGRQLDLDAQSTSTAISAAIPVLVSALARNAGNASGASSLSAALDRDHDGSVLDDLAGFFGKPEAAREGNGILSHVLGSRRSAVEAGLGQATGIGNESMSQLLAMLAPVVMGALGKSKQEQGLKAGGLGEFLGGEARKIGPQPDALNGILSLLDSDKDGSVMDDLAKAGSQLLGGLFGPGRK